MMILRTLLILLLCATGAGMVHGQARRITSNDPITAGRNDLPPLNNSLGSPEDEMRARNDIKIAEKEWQENLDWARETAQLGVEVQKAFSDHRTLGSVEMKKLERMEKLARRIRSRAGGSEDDEVEEKTPDQLDSTLTRLAETSEALRKGVEKTPRMVISAGVIERANELIEIIRFVRTKTR